MIYCGRSLGNLKRRSVASVALQFICVTFRVSFKSAMSRDNILEPSEITSKWGHCQFKEVFEYHSSLT
jgi:hypothetical protein